MCLLEFPKIKEGSVFYFSRFRKFTYGGQKGEKRQRNSRFSTADAPKISHGNIVREVWFSPQRKKS